MNTYILHENGNTYQLKVKDAGKTSTANIIYINGKSYELISKIKLNNETITYEMSQRIKPNYNEIKRNDLKNGIQLLECLKSYTDKTSEKIKTILQKHINNPNGLLADKIGQIRPMVKYSRLYDLKINNLLSAIFFDNPNNTNYLPK